MTVPTCTQKHSGTLPTDPVTTHVDRSVAVSDATMVDPEEIWFVDSEVIMFVGLVVIAIVELVSIGWLFCNAIAIKEIARAVEASPPAMREFLAAKSQLGCRCASAN